MDVNKSIARWCEPKGDGHEPPRQLKREWNLPAALLHPESVGAQAQSKPGTCSRSG